MSTFVAYGKRNLENCTSTYCTGITWGRFNQGILTNRYTQSEFKLKFSALLKACDVTFTENRKNITLKNNFLDYNHLNN